MHSRAQRTALPLDWRRVRSTPVRLALKCLSGGIFTLVAAWAVLAQAPGIERARRSGYADMRPATQALQDDDGQNPALLWVAEGEALWQRKAGPAQRACMDCHGAARSFWRDVVPRYPALDPMSSRGMNLGQRINQCRARHQGEPPWPPEQRERLSLEALAGHAARGQAIAPPRGDAMDRLVEQGQRLYQQRIGQLNLSCAQCHDGLAGGRLAASVIPQGHPTGYPIYRLEWQTLGSLQRRLRGCLTGVRAEPLPPDGDEVVALEAYLMRRAAGMPLETPAVRP